MAAQLLGCTNLNLLKMLLIHLCSEPKPNMFLLSTAQVPYLVLKHIYLDKLDLIVTLKDPKPLDFQSISSKYSNNMGCSACSVSKLSKLYILQYKLKRLVFFMDQLWLMNFFKIIEQKLVQCISKTRWFSPVDDSPSTKYFNQCVQKSRRDEDKRKRHYTVFFGFD